MALQISRARVRSISTLLSTIGLAACSLCERSAPVGLESRAVPRGLSSQSVMVEGDQRSYDLYVPAAAARGKLLPLMIVLHGSGADGETVRRMSHLDDMAEKRRFIVVFPNGTSGMFGMHSDWNAGMCCGTASERNTNDIAFIHQLIAALPRSLPIDTNRVYVAGFSDGARMAYHVGCDLSEEVAAIGVISGSLVDSTCHPSRAVPMIAFHGTDDHDVGFGEEVPVAMSVSVGLDADTLPRSLSPSVATWAAINGCRTRVMSRESEHVMRWSFARCDGDSKVELYAIRGAGHAWPGGARDGSGDVPSPEISASMKMTDFLFAHVRQPPGARVATVASLDDILGDEKLRPR